MKNIKIILVGSGVVSIPPKRGGATELIIYELSKFLAGNSCDVLVYDIREKSNKRAENINGAAYERLSVPRPGNPFLLRLSEFLFGIKALIRSRRAGADIVHCQTVFSALPFALFRPLISSKLVYTSHNPAWTAGENDFFNSAVLKLEGWLMKRFDAVTTVSNEMKRSIISAGVSGVHVIYNFVDTKKFSPKGKWWKKKAGVQGPLVLFVGKLTKNKGVEYFIRAAADVRKDIPEAKFVLVGPMSFEYEAKNVWQDMVNELSLQDTVLFAGPAADAELPSRYSAADVFCFPTLKEAFGIVVIEAMACGIPVVATKLPVLEEVAGSAAVFVSPRNPEATARAIVKVLSDRKLAGRLRALSLKRKSLFEKDKMLEGYLNLYKSLAHEQIPEVLHE